jgi:acetyltransferase
VLARLGGLLASHPGVEAIEINPLRVTKDGLVALDAAVLLQDRHRKEAADGFTDR